MGWGGNDSEYYIIGDDQSLTFNTGFAEFASNISVYANIKHN